MRPSRKPRHELETLPHARRIEAAAARVIAVTVRAFAAAPGWRVAVPGRRGGALSVAPPRRMAGGRLRRLTHTLDE